MKKYILAAFIGVMMVSCTEDVMDDINKDNANPLIGVVPAKMQITDAIMSSAFTTSSGNYAWTVASLTEQEFGTGGNQFQNIEVRNSNLLAASTSFNNEWNGTYSNIFNLKNIMSKTSEGGINEGQVDILAMAQILYALNYGILTDLHGDIPCSEAAEGTKNINPKLDSQKDVYENAVLGMLDKAIVNCQAAIADGMNNAGAQDILYRGNMQKWLGAAYALKARYLLHMSYVNPNVWNEVITACNNAIDAGFNGMELNVFNGTSTDNPWFAFYISREATASCATPAEMMQATNDPRYDIYVYPYYFYGDEYADLPEAGDGEMAAWMGGLDQPCWLYYQRTDRDPALSANGGAAPIHLMSKSELYFILAEAQVRTGADPSDAFANAVVASFADFSKFAEEPLDATPFLATLGTPDIAVIMQQKYISQLRDEQIETYNDIRRCKAMGEQYITLKNPNNIQGGQNRWPERLPYGNSSVVSNPNVRNAYGNGSYVFTEKTWLNGGTK